MEYVILGGGLAGLCAAKRLLELGIQPMIIEAGTYPAQKVCGEFISPSSIPILNQWGIHPIPIHHLQVHTVSRELNLTFSKPAGSLSRMTLDVELANQISQRAPFLTQTKVLEISPATEGGDHSLVLSSGEKIRAKHLLIATGRIPGLFTQAPPRYIGLKAHFSGLDLHSTLRMFSNKSTYFGISPVGNGVSNLACLTTIEQFKQFSSAKEFMQWNISSYPSLHSDEMDWMEVSVPAFGWKSTPHWPNTYWIGDAAGTIPPASGNGLSLAIASGYLAAEYAAKNQAQAFKKVWRKRCAFHFQCGKGLHRLFLNPSWGSKMISLCHYFPFLAQKIFDFTRDPGDPGLKKNN